MTTRRPPVTVVGLGSMGAALAQAFLDAGHPTTVWNRTAAKAASLVERGATLAASIDDAVRAVPLVVTCLTGYDDTRKALEPATASLPGLVLVPLNSGTPAGARDFAAWAAGHGARVLDGAVKNVPAAVGAPDTLIYYGGDRPAFDEHADTLRALGGRTEFLGDEPDLAAFYESAVGATLLPALVGFFQGAAAAQARGLPVSALVPYSIAWLEMIGSVLPTFADEIDSGDYSAAASSVNLFLAGIAWDEEFGREAGVDTTWQEPLHDLIRRAAAAGHGEHSIAALVEVMRRPE